VKLYPGCNEESFSKHVDMISARGQLSDLQQKLESSETQRKRARIEYERDLEIGRKDRQVSVSLLCRKWWHKTLGHF